MLPIVNLLFVLIALLGNFVIGLFTYHKNPKSHTNQLFFSFAVVIGLYLYTNYLSIYQSSDSGTFFWIKIVMSIAILINTVFFLFIHTFPQNKVTLKKSYLWGIFVFTGVTLAAIWLNLIFSGVKPGTNEPIPSIGMPLFLAHTFLLVGGGVIALFRKYRKQSGKEKVQLKLLLLGTILMFGAILITNLFLVVFLNNSTLVGFLPLYTLVFFGFISYAIVKHRFLDIGILVARAVAYSLVILLIATIYSLFILLVGKFYLGLNLTIPQQLILIFITVLISISFQRVQRVLERITDKLLYRDKYNADELLSTLSKIMASTLRLEDLTHGVLEELLREVRITQAAFVLLEKDSITDVKSEGFLKAPTLDEEEIKLLSKSRSMLIFDEMEESVEKKILRSLDISVVVHLRTEGTQVGLLLVGAKQSGDIYSSQDLKVLEILAPEIAVAIQNAKAYEEIRRFNITLQDEVNKATKDLQLANVKLQELDKLKDEFVSLASHELRTPMTAIKGSLSTILDGYAGTISADAKDFLTAAYNENDRLIRLVNNLLNISRIEAGRFNFTVIKVDMNKLIDEVVHNLETYANEKSLYLKYEKTEKEAMVFADEDKVKEVLINLIGNALKFTHHGGVSIKAVKDASMLKISVNDTGSGIAKEDQDLLFKKFSQVPGKNYARQTGGTGLGLYISKQIVEGLKGSVWLESTLEKGSSFFFTLPLVTK